MTTLIINNKKVCLELQGNETLLEVLRDLLGMTGTKTACSEAECGACTVIVNGRAVLSCITLAAAINGAEVTTIEGLADSDSLHPIQQAFLDKGAVQCGFCTPGMIMSAKALLDKQPDPTLEEIKSALDGNLCRCGGYIKIFESVEHAAQIIRDNKNKT